MNGRALQFAQDPTNQPAANVFFAEQIAAAPDLHWALLIDSAFDHTAEEKISTARGFNCYAEDPLDDLETVAPWLLTLDNGEVGKKRLAEAIAHCGGRPMLSVLASTQPLRSLVESWHSYHWLHASDGQRFILRFADTRVLPVLSEILQPQQWAAIRAPLAHWFYIDRSGNPVACPEAPASAVVPPRLEVTQQQLDRFVEFAEPDTAADFIFSHSPELMPHGASGYDVHQHFSELFAFARKHRVDLWADKMALITVDLLTRGRFRRNPKFEELMLNKAWEPGALGDCLEAHGIV